MNQCIRSPFRNKRYSTTSTDDKISGSMIFEALPIQTLLCCGWMVTKCRVKLRQSKVRNTSLSKSLSFVYVSEPKRTPYSPNGIPVEKTLTHDLQLGVHILPRMFQGMGIIALTYLHGIATWKSWLQTAILKRKLQSLDLSSCNLKPAKQIRNPMQLENKEAHVYEDFCDLVEETFQQFNLGWPHSIRN